MRWEWGERRTVSERESERKGENGREWERKGEWENERDRVSLCERVKVRECVCVCVWDREWESERWREIAQWENEKLPNKRYLAAIRSLRKLNLTIVVAIVGLFLWSSKQMTSLDLLCIELLLLLSDFYHFFCENHCCILQLNFSFIYYLFETFRHCTVLYWYGT